MKLLPVSSDAEPRTSHFADATHFLRAANSVEQLLVTVAPEQWATPTPCAQWDLAQLTEHLIDTNYIFAAKLGGAPGTTYVKEAPAHAAIERFRMSTEQLHRALTVVERDNDGLPAHLRERLALRVSDLLIHGWDIATATGQLAQMPDDITEEAIAFARRRMGALRRSGKFAPAQPVDDHAPALDRLAALSGRIAAHHDRPTCGSTEVSPTESAPTVTAVDRYAASDRRES